MDNIGALKNIEKNLYNIGKNMSENIEKNMIDLIVNENNFKANIKTIEVKNQMLGTVVDLKV